MSNDFITAKERLSNPFFKVEVSETTKAFCLGMITAAAIFAINLLPARII